MAPSGDDNRERLLESQGGHMPTVVVQRVMHGVDLDSVWKIVRDLPSYPAFMEQVLSVEACDLGAGRTGTSWIALFNGNELRWIEEDEYFDSEYKMTFQQLEGDLAQWQGAFQAEAMDGHIVARYEVKFDLGIPALSHVLNPLGERAIRSNCEQMLESVEHRSRAGSAGTHV